MLIRFTRDVQVETEGRHKGPVYKAGSEVDLPLPSAHRWLRRGVAVAVTVEPRRIMTERPMMAAEPRRFSAAEVEPTFEVKAEPAPEPASEAEPQARPVRRGRRRRG